MAKTFYITTAIDYTNAAPHIGHAYEKILADVIARYQRLAGRDTYFLTGVDQHGQKVQQTAQKNGQEPGVFAAEVTEKFTSLWQKLGLSFDGWAATTDERHKRCVRKILLRLFDEGQIYKATHGGFYSIRQEQFLTDKERNEDGEFGAEWGEVIFVEEENYYFNLARHRDWLLALIDSREDLVFPEFRRTELRNAVEKLSGDLCISRPKERLSWGIELPFDAGYVTYVWFDALINYISFAGYLSEGDGTLPDFSKLWPADAHVIGKDIMVPAHGIYWPVMLHALGFSDTEIPRLLVHGYINSSGAKMSKSLGNIVDPDALADKYGAGALRYYLMRDTATGYDMEFSEERLVGRYNSDLANSLGNLLNRALNMAQRYRSGKLARQAGGTLQERAAACVEGYRQAMETGSIHLALEKVMALATEANQFVEETAPWKLAKDPAQADRLDEALYCLAESLRIIAILISPVLPEAAQGILSQLNWSQSPALSDAAWGALPSGHELGTPSPLFPRIEPA